MATYSTNLALTLMATGEQSNTWGDTTNTNLGTLLEQAISGYVTQAITDGSSANTTITIPNGATGVARNMFIEMTGALTFSTTSLIVPANKKLYFIYNNTTGGFAVTVKVSGQTGVSVPNGKKVVLVSNGTDIVNAENYIASLSVGALTSGRVPYAGTSGLLQDSANLTFNGTTLTANTIGAFTLSGTVAGGGNQLNNVVIGTTTPLAGAFTTLSADNNTVLASAGNTKTVQIGSLSAPANVGTLQQTFNGASVWGGQTTVGGETDFGWNFYYYGGFKSRLADVASRLSFNATSGRVSFWTAPSPGSADAALTFTEALRIDATTGVTALGAMAVGNGLAVTGTLTSTLDATHYGVTVGRGGGAVIGNTVLGASALISNLTSTGITAVGYVAGQDATAGDYSTYIGYLSGQHALGAQNTAVGSYSLNNVSGTGGTGTWNAALGRQALYSNTSGSYNTALGASALQSNTTSSYNTAVGYQAGYSHQSVGYNTFVGYQAGYSDTGGQQTAFGYQALKLATSGRSTAIGQQAAAANLTGSVVALGAGALKGNTTGIGNVGLGGTYSGYNSALEANQTGSWNVAVGDGALTSNVSANYNTAVGSAALYQNTASRNTAVGYQAGYSNQTGANNVTLGYQALYSNTIGYNSIAIGYQALYNSNRTVDDQPFNIAIGYLAASGLTTGSGNTVLGYQALATATSAGSQVAIGYYSAYSRTINTGETYASTFVGSQAGYAVTSAIELTFIGGFAGRYQTGNYNTAVGSAALYGASGTSTGTSNSAVGYASLFSNTSGSSNTGIGNGALYSNTTASYNTAVGYQAGYLSTGAGNQCFGYSSGSAVTSGAKNVILGSYTGAAAPISATGSNYVVLSDGDGNIVASSKTAQTFALQGGTLSSGTGIAFPATQSASSDANTLDDYEEGTWTPSLTSWTVVGTPTYTGYYTKVGRQVTVVMQLTATTSIASTGASYVNNLPFSQGVTTVGSMATMTDNGGTGSASNGYISGVTYYPGSSSATQYKYLTATYFTS